ncbi:MAG TPA: hypothetical protein DCS89_10845 [Gammaproteobacteria bacterium]|jgi:hypothetical protein|nr:hypothetical protein [Gammaproteobacteria bacterium]HAT27504.1 hypothetical protein [Gammaproteobacteria bacterium]|tara:strand:- start:63 stop:425 length:363 start_codon:yes stop_codon:yes gene_type:complete
MSKILFKLRDVPAEEAQEVRELLERNDIEYYETLGGNWGISLPALWLKKEAQRHRARELLDTYQRDREGRAREEYERTRLSGEPSTRWTNFAESPFRFIAHLGLIVLVLFLSLRFFLSFQ